MKITKEQLRKEKVLLNRANRVKAKYQQKLLKCMNGDVTSHIYCAQFVLHTKDSDETELQRLMDVVIEYDLDLNNLETMAHRARNPEATTYNKHPVQLQYWVQLLERLEEDPICKEVLGNL